VVGSRPLTGLDGYQLAPADAAGRLLLAWLCALAPILAFAAIGLLASVIFGRSPIGLLLPAFGGLAMQLASQALPMPVAIRLGLPSFAFLSWNGLFTSPPMLGPVLTGIAVSLAWAVTATALAYVLFMRRDFTSLANDGSMRRAITFGILPLLGVWVLSAGVVAAATGATGSGIDASKLQGSLATSFAHLYRVQSKDVNHLNVTEAQLRTTASCTKGQGLVAQNGPGNDWRCYVYWHLPGVNNATGQAIYQIDVNPNGRYIADGDGPNEVNGYFVVHAPYGDAPNPLWQFDGLVDLLSTTSKG
jgi:ABC-2 type transport system permease protein